MTGAFARSRCVSGSNLEIAPIAPLSRLGRQIAEVSAALHALGARFALIGGLALASHNVVRATQDVDLLSAPCCAPIAPRWTWMNCAGIFDFSTASRCSMNSFAKPAEPPFAAEGSLGASSHREEDPYRVLDDLMAAVEALCPAWPQRDAFADGGRMLL